MQVATGGCLGVVGVEYPAEQKASVHCATAAADLEATVHSLLPDEKPATSTHKVGIGLFLGTDFHYDAQWRRFLFSLCR